MGGYGRHHLGRGDNFCCPFCRKRTIEENMKNMPKMVEEYRAKMREIRRVSREKKETSEEKKYLLATGKLSETPSWQAQIEEQRKKKTK